MTWIFGNARRDFLFLIAPGLLGILLSHWTLSHLNADFWLPIFGLIILGMIDSGHVYMTIWRTWLHPEERRSNTLYWVAPLAIFIVLIAWLQLGLPFLWTFTVYATIFHHIRQYYGIQRWYQRLNQQDLTASGYFLYLLTFLPVIAFHFREGMHAHYYTDHDIVFYPNPFLRNLFIALDVVCFIAWAIFELRRWRQGFREWNRIGSIFFPAAMYALVFLKGETAAEILFPLVLTHGIGYLGMMSLSLQRSRRQIFTNFMKAMFVLIVTAIAFGVFEFYAELEWIDIDQNYIHGISLLETILIGFYLTPLFCHYLFDAVIWKGNHREASLVYSLPP